MKSDIEITRLIESYLEGSLSSKEKDKFEKELLTNSKLQKEFELHKDIRKTFKIKGKESLKEELNDYHEEYEKEKISRNNKRILWPLISAAATILIILYLVVGKNTPSSTDDYITLDSAAIKTSPNYADSASYNSTIINDTLKK